ncbi:ABC transporter substrate-binding protein [Chelatococcus sp. GCM10030263]|uniref:ABC transporter substrate-binding protein n=1 Tax=Chelatococcus sp. GCM10030263 TaxID=3273387 RepID=UPI003616A1AC
MTTMDKSITGAGRHMVLDRRRVLLGTSAGLGGLALTKAGLGTARAATSDTLVYGLSAFPPGIAPFQHAGAASNTVKLLIFRGLLGLDSEGKVVADLAESWAPDGDRAYVFKLRSNAKFHNGLPVTASDVKFSLEQISAPESTAYLINEFRGVERIEEIDPSTVRIVMKEPTPSILENLAGPYAPIISAKAHASDPANPIGAGPYKITKTEKGVAIEFERFADYYKPGLPKTPKLRMIVYKDESLRVAALESGDVDIIEYVPWQNMDAIAANSQLVLQESLGPIMYLSFNVERPPFNDKRVRQAVAYAIKREDIVKAAFFGRGAPLAGLPIGQESEFYSDALANLWPYDPDKAKQLLQDAGALGTKVTLLSTGTYNMHKDTAEIVQQHLMAAGLMVELSLPEWGARVAQGNKGQYQFAVNGGAMAIADPDGLTGLIGTQSPSYRRSFGYSSSKVDQLLAEARHSTESEKRKAFYAQVAEVVEDEVPLCSLSWRSQGYAMTTKVKGFDTIPGILNSYSGFILEDAYIG